MHFDWTINVTSLLGVVGAIAAVITGIFKFQSWIRVSQLKADHTVDLLALRIHTLEEWMKNHIVESEARNVTGNELKAAVAKLTYMAETTERRMQRLEDADVKKP